MICYAAFSRIKTKRINWVKTTLTATTKVNGEAADPMAEGTIFDIKKFAIHDGPGIRTTVFLKGCPMNCWWCHNPEGQHPDPEPMAGGLGDTGAITVGTLMRVDQVMAEIEKDLLFYDESGGGVTFSGGEPLMQPEFLAAMLERCSRSGIHTALDTTGHAPADIMARISPLVDLFLYDLKLLDDAKHRKYTGVSNNRLLTNLRHLARNGREVIIRFPLIPHINDTPDHLEKMKFFMKEMGVRRIDLLPYHDIHRQKFHRLGHPDRLGDLAPPGADVIDRVKADLARDGFAVTIGG